MSSVDSYDEKTRRRVDDNSNWFSWLRKTRLYLLPCCTCAVNDVDVQEQHEVSGKERSTTIPRETASAQIFGGITTTVTTTTTMSSISPEAMAEAARSWEASDDDNGDVKKAFSDRRRRRWANAGYIPPILRLADDKATNGSDPTSSTASYGSHPTYSTASRGSNHSRSTYTPPPPPPPPPNTTPNSSVTPTLSFTPSSTASPTTPSSASVSPRVSAPLLSADGHDDLQRWAQSTSAALSWLSGSPEEQNVPARRRRRWGYVQQKG